MFGLGPTELIVIFVLALLVLGPTRLPELASSLGKAIRSFRRATKDLRDQIDIEDEVRRPFEDLQAALRGDTHLPPATTVRPTAPLISAPGDPIIPVTPEPYHGPYGHYGGPSPAETAAPAALATTEAAGTTPGAAPSDAPAGSELATLPASHTPSETAPHAPAPAAPHGSPAESAK